MFAIIETGGKQYRVKQGDTIRVEKLTAGIGDRVEFKEVLALGEGNKVAFGAPLLVGACIVGKVLDHGKEKKIIVFRYKAKSRYRKKNGHRQPYTRVFIESVSAN